MELAVGVAELQTSDRVERAERLVHKHDLRPGRQGPGEAHPLLLAAGQFRGPAS